MRALIFNKTGGIENLQWAEVPNPPKPKSQEVRLRLRAASLNHLDLWILKGLPRMKYEFPHICGADFCGEVLESKSAKFKKGERVLVYPAQSSPQSKREKTLPENLHENYAIRGENAPGVFCEELLVNERYLVRAPAHLNDAEAASLPLVYLTAWQMLVEKAGILPGLRNHGPILVHGVGSGVSQALLELLFSFGIRKVATTSRSQEKLARWIKRGYDGFILREHVADEIKQWAGDERVHMIFDHVGEALFDLNIRLLRRGGKLITCGATSGWDSKLDLRHLYFRQLQLLGSTMGSLKHFHAAMSWVQKKRIRPLIAAEFTMAKASQAYSLMEKAGQNGKIVLVP